MKKYITLCLGLGFGLLSAQNTLLEKEFWKKQPTLSEVQSEISKGNSPTEADDASFDVVTQAILADAPIEVITYLVKLSGNGVNKLTHDSRIYLHWAGYRKNINLAKWLIKEGASVTHKDSYGYTPLSFAAITGMDNPEYYDLFFSHGVNINETYQDGAKIHQLAIANDTPDLKLLQFFVFKGLNPKDKDNLGHTLADYAARSQNPELVKKLIDSGIPTTDAALLFATKGNKKGLDAKPIFDYLTETLNISPNVVDKDENTVLHLFLSGRQTNDEMAAYFINKGVNAEQPNSEGITPLMKAVQRNKKDLVDLIFSKGVQNINSTTKKGRSTLSYAFSNANLPMVGFLVNKGADVNIIDDKGNNLAYYAIDSYSSRDKESIEKIVAKLNFLKNEGVDIAKPQADANTMAHWAVKKGNAQLLEALKPFVTNWNVINAEGLTPLHLAAMTAKDGTTIEALLQLGADKNIKTSFDETAYDLAKDNELLKDHKEILKTLK